MTISDFDLRVLSLGAGVQSTAMYLMALDGLFPSVPDVAIFADTQQEPPWVYENLWRLAERGADRIPIVIATAGDLGRSILTAGDRDLPGRFASVPFWVAGEDGREAPGRRHCTREYKIDVVKREIRSILGLTPRQHASGRFRVEEWVGISLDEASRAKPSRYDWIKTRWPLLLDRPMRRRGIRAWLDDRGWPSVRKSACIQCPWRGALEYAEWRRDYPDLFDTACWWDDKIREMGPLRGMKKPQYILRSLVPLRCLPDDEALADEPGNQLNLFENECEGMCGV